LILGNDVLTGTKSGSGKSLAYECLPRTCVAIGATNSGCIQSANCLARAFDFAVRYTKGEERCVYWIENLG